MSTIKLSSITNKAKTSGPVIVGVTTSTATGYAHISTVDTSERVGIESGSLRYNKAFGLMEFYDGTQWNFILPAEESANALGVFGGGNIGSAVRVSRMNYITISTLGDATYFGNLTAERSGLAACSSSTRGVFGGGYSPTVNIIDYITIATTGNATDFGDITTATDLLGGCSSNTRGIFGGGTAAGTPANTISNTIYYITIATTGNTNTFGSLTQSRYTPAGCSSSTRGVFAGGAPTDITVTNTIDYITIASQGTNALDFGDLTVSRCDISACTSSTRGLFAGGKTQRSPAFIDTDRIDYITIATTGTALFFGSLSSDGSYRSGCSSSVRGVFHKSTSSIQKLEYVTIATTGNTLPFGTLFASDLYGTAACSNNHGGLL